MESIAFRAYQVFPLLLFAARRGLTITMEELHDIIGSPAKVLESSMEIISCVCKNNNIPDIGDVVIGGGIVGDCNVYNDSIIKQVLMYTSEY